MKKRHLVFHGLLLAGLLVATAGMRHAARAAGAGSSDIRQVAALPSLPFLEAVSLGYRELAADIAWLLAVQYYGEHRQGGNDLSQFEHYVHAVNVLDPRYENAYIFGAVVLATDGADLDKAFEVLRRGARAHPDSPVFLFEMGFLAYVQGHDLEAAQRYLELSARKPGGYERARRFQAFLNRKMGRLETAWMLWNEIHRTTQNPGMRAVAAENLRRLEAEYQAQKQAQDYEY